MRVFKPTAGRMIFCLFALACVNSAAVAQVTTFFGNDNPRGSITNSTAAETAFLSSFPLTGTDNLDSYPIFLPTSLSFGNGTTATNNANFVINDGSIGFTWSISSPNLLVHEGDPSPTLFNINRPVNGFGLYIVDAGDGVANQFSFILSNSATGYTVTVPVNGNPDGSGSPTVIGPGRDLDSVLYFGVNDTTAFDTVTISPLFDGTQDGLLFDNISVGFAAVPEPTTYALLGSIGLAVAGRRYWLKRKQKQQMEGRFKLAR
jgi:PEP-CTERM motif